MAQTTEVYTNSTWLDYDRWGIWKRQVTLSNGPSWIAGSPWITAVTAVLLAFASPSAYMILTRLLVWSISSVWRKFFKDEQDDTKSPDGEDSAAVDDDETTRLNTTKHSASGAFSPYSRVGEIMWSSRTPDFAVWDLGKLIKEIVLSRKANRTRSAYLWRESILAIALILLISACLGLFVSFAIGGMVSSGIVGNSVVLSDAPKCGVWVLDEEMKNAVIPRVPDHYYYQELEASEYAKHCFGAPSDSDGCNYFMVPDFEVYPRDHTACPFSPDLCLEASSAFTLSTKSVGSKQLGINVPSGYIFNRTTTCVPLKRDGYVSLSADGAFYEYRYGSNSDVGAATWRSLVNQTSGYSGYNMQTVSSLRNNWEPIEEFRTTLNKEITLLFIQSENVFYTDKRHDPIFPAEASIISPVDGSTLYYNTDRRATVLACVDWKDICHPSGAPCFPHTTKPDPESSEHIERVGYYMLLLSIRRSSIGDAVQLRGGSALDASSKVVGNRSAPLPMEQWKVEARAAFEASLARMQITLRDLIRGAAADEDWFENHMDSGMEAMCHMYKFRSVGWSRATVATLWFWILSAVAVYVLGIEIDIESEDDDDDKRDDGESEGANRHLNRHFYGSMRETSDPSSSRSHTRTSLVAAFVAWWIGDFIWRSGLYIHKLVVLRKLKDEEMPVDEEAETQVNAEPSGSSPNGYHTVTL